MDTKNIIGDAELLERARQIQREKKRAYNRQWRRDFKKKYGIDYALFLEMKHLKESRDCDEEYPPGVLIHR